MATFAILTGNLVTQVILADDQATALAVSPKGVTAIEYTAENPAGIGWKYYESTKKFVQPVEVSNA